MTVLFMLRKLLSNSFQNFPEGATPSFIVHDISMDFPLYNDVSRGETVLLWYPGEAVESTCDGELDWDIILNL